MRILGYGPIVRMPALPTPLYGVPTALPRTLGGLGQDGPNWPAIEEVAARYPNIWDMILQASRKYATTYGLQREFINPSVIAEKVYQIRSGIPPQGPVEEAVYEGTRDVLEQTGVIEPSPERKWAQAIPILLAGAVGLWLIARTTRR